MRELRQNWLDLFSAFRIAVDPKKMLLGFVALFLCLLWVWLMLGAMSAWYPRGQDILLRAATWWAEGSQQEGVVALNTLCRSVRSHLANLGLRQIVLLLVGGLPALLICAYFGGALLRSAAVEFCKDDRIDVSEATAFTWRKLWSYFWAPLVPAIGIVVLLLCIYVGGLFGRIPVVGPLAVGVFFFLALLAGFLIVLLAIGGVFGSVLMGPTIAVEGTDAFDAVSRAFSYVYGRPWRYIWYHLVGGAYWTVCVAFVGAFTWAMVRATLWAGAAGMGASFEPVRHVLANFEWARGAPFFPTLCGWLLLIALVLVWGLVAGFAVSMCGSLSTITYCLLRKDVDGTEMGEVFIEEEEEQGQPEGGATAEEGAKPAEDEKSAEAPAEEKAGEQTESSGDAEKEASE